jgi:hypothetical protein
MEIQNSGAVLGALFEKRLPSCPFTRTALEK